ncbi:uncharacterized protein BDW43DRAFT_257584 [Aspergillus alliaceus]|uniref:uncharacterized protein n=1 Tax=Petromyces alliaceus TaxID=209559 RepID=UPI0012A3F95D|nr:uncharacterized protein BDW43DRAFT_257584 [Aspergillus alliaceus]KAB8239323.1 hypothetical protein BDW43DRAFT_257584 [Aspergillus alliaceus]
MIKPAHLAILLLPGLRGALCVVATALDIPPIPGDQNYFAPMAKLKIIREICTGDENGRDNCYVRGRLATDMILTGSTSRSPFSAQYLKPYKSEVELSKGRAHSSSMRAVWIQGGHLLALPTVPVFTIALYHLLSRFIWASTLRHIPGAVVEQIPGDPDCCCWNARAPH